jgi:hypothetical protein
VGSRRRATPTEDRIVAVEQSLGALSLDAGYTEVLREATVLSEIDGIRVVVGLIDFVEGFDDPEQDRQIFVLNAESELLMASPFLQPELSSEVEANGGGSSKNPGTSLIAIVSARAKSAIAYFASGAKSTPILIDPVTKYQVVAVVAPDGDVLHGVRILDAEGDTIGSISAL